MESAAHLTSEIIDSIRTHHASGHFTREEAAARIRVAGFGRTRSDEQVAAILALPVGPGLFAKFKTWPCDSALLPLGSAPVEPCVKSLGHDGLHQTKRGVRWADPDDGEETRD